MGIRTDAMSNLRNAQRSNSRVTLAGRTTFRRPYKKSTTGCSACKSRKIKCDEARPVCGSCKRYYTNASACQYSRQIRTAEIAVRGPEPTVLSIRPVTLDSTNILALRLMHHYTISVGFGQSLKCSQKDLMAHLLWESEIPSIAFKSEVVLNAVLGISAWHLWAMNPDDQKMILTSRAYLGKAIRLQRVAIAQDDDQELIPAFIAGIVIAHHSWLLSHFHGETARDRLQLGTYHLCNGYRSLTTRISPTWSKYAFLGDFTVTDPQPRPSNHELIMKKAIQDSKFLHHYIQNTETNQQHKRLYPQMLEKILLLYAIVTNDCEDVTTKEHTIVTHFHRVPSSFIDLLENKQPLAMGLLARVWASLVLLKNHSRAWYIHGAGAFQVYHRAVLEIRNLMPCDWMWLLDWPMQLISGELELLAK